MGSLNPPVEERNDVIIIGAGLSGLCSLHHIRDRFPHWRVRVLEAGSNVGGTWYRNTYPGARFDSESLSYGFSWDKELLEQWHWKEAFSPQPETLKYIECVAEKHDLCKDIQFDTRIVTAQWKNDDRLWLLQDQSGNAYMSRFFVSCVGFLSAPTLPNIPGVQDFKGQAFHTSRWPKNKTSSDFAHQRVGIIGTGASGIQTITELAKEPRIASLTVFQRTANWSAPLRNSKISSERMIEHRKEYDAVFKKCSETPMGFMHAPDPRNSLDVTEDERYALWDRLYQEPGFGKWVGVFKDTYTDREANRMYSEYMAEKIRQRVQDPQVADSLIPKDHGFGTRRVPLESGYFEAYNRSNVHLVDLKKTPIDSITSNGIEMSDGEKHELDTLIFATGFDAITGAFKEIDWHGKDGRSLIGQDDNSSQTGAIWAGHRPKTFLGVTVPAMPNMFMVLGPHQPFGNATRNIEHAVGVVVDLLQYCHDNHYYYVEPTEAAVDEWTQHVFECSKGQLSNEVDSWMTGVNKNVQGKTTRTVARYAGSAVEYRRRCAACKLSGWKGLHFE